MKKSETYNKIMFHIKIQFLLLCSHEIHIYVIYLSLCSDEIYKYIYIHKNTIE